MFFLRVKLSLLILTGLCTSVLAQPASSYALRMNGSSQYANCGTMNLSNGEVTIQGWIRVESFKASSPYITSFAGIEQPGSHCAVRIGDASIPNNKVQFILYIGGTHHKLHSQQALTTNQWYHLAATYDGSQMKIYINGVLDTIRNQTGTIVSNNTFELGRNYANSRILQGSLDEVSVWSSALSQSAIRDWMCKRVTTNHPYYGSLIAYYPFDEGDGNSSSDASGNGYNASLQSSPQWKNSGAPVGNQSKHVYTSTFDLGLSHPDGDSIHFTSTSGSFQGVHIYRTDSAPIVTAAPSPLQYLDTSRYWGIFPIIDAEYDVDYYYDGNSTANGIDCNLSFGQRDDGSENSWVATPPTSANYTSEVLSFSGSGQSEFIMAVSSTGPHTFGFDVDEPLCNGDANGNATVQLNGGTPPYSYDWQTGSTTNQSGAVSAGTYLLTVTDADGCESTDSVVVGEPTSLGFSSNSNPSICKDTNTGSATAVPSGGVGGYTFLWSNGGTTQSISSLLPGTYLVTVQDSNGCEITGDALVGSVGPDPMPNLGGDSNVCEGVVFGMTVSGNGGPFTSYAWSGGSTGAINIVSGPGIYSVTVSNAQGCTGSDTVEISYVEPVEVELGPYNQSAVGALTLDAGTSFSTYQWNTGATTSSLTVTQSAIYWVKVKDQNLCQSADTVNVTILTNGIEEEHAELVKLFPNPAAEFIQLKTTYSDEGLMVDIRSIDGKLMNQLMLNSDQIIDVSDYQRGWYLLQWKTEEGEFVSLPFEKL